MPVREIKTIDYFISYTGKTVTMTETAHTDLLYILAMEESYNKAISKNAEDIQKELVSTIPSITVKARTYRNTIEGKGYEVINPRNYLTKEVIEVRVGNAEHIFFLGNFGTTQEAPFYIIQKLKEQYGKQPNAKDKSERNGTERGVNLDRETIESVRLQFRKCKP